jgi:hypothetical protein
MEEEEESEEPEQEFYMSVFDMFDKKTVVKSLRHLPQLREHSPDIFEWYAGRDGGESEFQGIVTVSTGTLVLSAVSEVMREAGKLMLRSACRSFIRHRADYTDIESLVDE